MANFCLWELYFVPLGVYFGSGIRILGLEFILATGIKLRVYFGLWELTFGFCKKFLHLSATVRPVRVDFRLLEIDSWLLVLDYGLME